MSTPPLLGEGLVARRVVVARRDVALFKAICDASEGLGIVFAERGGDLVVATPCSRATELDELLADLSVDLGVDVRPLGSSVPVCAPERGRRAGLPSQASQAVHAAEARLRARRQYSSVPVMGDPLLEPGQATSLPSGEDTASAVNEATEQRGGASDSRVLDAWCAWLDALATDAEAALAAAMAYKDLDGVARETWLRALEQDCGRVGVPRIAMYAPLLAVESDPERRRRIHAAMDPADSRATPRVPPHGLRGLLADGPRASEGLRVATVVSPLYLDFVQVLACAYHPDRGFEWVRHDPIVNRAQAPKAGEQVGGVTLEALPLNTLVDELALTVLAHRRAGRELPEALRVFADLFGPGESSPASLP